MIVYWARSVLAITLIIDVSHPVRRLRTKGGNDLIVLLLHSKYNIKIFIYINDKEFSEYTFF